MTVSRLNYSLDVRHDFKLDIVGRSASRNVLVNRSAPIFMVS